MQLKPDAILAVMANRRVSVSVRPQLKPELKRLIKLGIIEPVDKTTPWVSQLIVTKKKDDSLGICLDSYGLNKAFIREHYTMPILEDVLRDMNNARIFTKAELSLGYWHINLMTISVT